jgi:anti-sigma factor RsiW
MKACVRYAPMIGARPGELSDEDARGLAEHLTSCDACQARLAEEEALAGMLPDALMAEASRRDFSAFSDEVLARIPAYRERPVPAEGWLAAVAAWVRRHRVAAATSVLAPAVAAVALILYLGRQPAPEPDLDVSTETGGAMVLETSDGPVVLLDESDEAT